MREITLDESKQIQLELLTAIHEFCEEQHLTYFLWFGTLLGAVRHHGFIPWDDDIDIVMPRKDYEVFRETFRADHASLVDAYTQPKYYYHVGKVVDDRTILIENTQKRFPIGVYVDVFVLDNVSENPNVNAKAVKRLLSLRNVLMLNLRPGSDKRKGYRRVLHKLGSSMLFLVNLNRVARRMDRVALQVCPEGNDKHCGILLHASPKGMKRVYERSLVAERVLLDFEGCQFWAPVAYDEILSRMYGDYMTPPPPAKQVSKHEYEQYWKE